MTQATPRRILFCLIVLGCWIHHSRGARPASSQCGSRSRKMRTHILNHKLETERSISPPASPHLFNHPTITTKCSNIWAYGGHPHSSHNKGHRKDECVSIKTRVWLRLRVMSKWKFRVAVNGENHVHEWVKIVIFKFCARIKVRITARDRLIKVKARIKRGSRWGLVSGHMTGNVGGIIRNYYWVWELSSVKVSMRVKVRTIQVTAMDRLRIKEKTE